MNLPIYLDHAATTPVRPEALEAMLPFFSDRFANPAALYAPGAEARDAVDSARETIASALNARPEEIIFTSGGTESDNWALRGALGGVSRGKRHVLTTAIEHSAILAACESLVRDGCEVELLPVDGLGLVDPVDVARRIRPDTAIVSVMHANNETGTVQPIAEIGALCRECGVPFHSDAVQTLGKLPLDVERLNADILSFSAHKLYGPKGIGASFVRRGLRLAPLLEGGHQERGRRSGTLNVPGIVGFAKAVGIAENERESEMARLRGLRDRLIGGIESQVQGARLCGSRAERLPNNAHFCFEGVEGEPLLLALDMAGICASAGSACSAGSTEPSHVLTAMGVPMETARGALRMTLGRSTTAEDVDYTVEQISRIAAELRRLGGT